MGIDYEFNDFIQFPSPYGDKLQLCFPLIPLFIMGFRPLAGCSFTIPHIESKEKNYTPEKRGWSRKDKS